MSWSIDVPHRGRDQTVIDALFDVRYVEDPESRAVTRALLEEAAESGTRSIGEFLDRIDRLDDAGRRRLLDEGRAACGLESTADVAARGEFERAQDAARRRAAQRPIPACAICGARPTGPGGMPQEVPPARRWHCPDHVAQAQSGDMEAPPLPIDFSTMTLIDPDEIAREQQADERRRQENERRRRDREAEAAAIRAARERYEESVAEDDYVRPKIAGIPGVRMDAR